MLAPCLGALLFIHSTFLLNVFLAVDEFHLKSALFDGHYTPLMFVFLTFILTRQDQMMYVTQIFERKTKWYCLCTFTGRIIFRRIVEKQREEKRKEREKEFFKKIQLSSSSRFKLQTSCVVEKQPRPLGNLQIICEVNSIKTCSLFRGTILF